MSRPVSENGKLEPTPEEQERFDYDAEPERFYMNLETVGSVAADRCFQQGVDVLQKKLADVIAALSPSINTTSNDYAPQSPGGGAMGQGFNTNYGAQSSYGNGSTSIYGDSSRTPYGMTSYGNDY